jgi:transposase InsO family protein
MQLHRNAKTTPKSRLEIVQRVFEGQRPEEVSEAFGLSVRSVYKWLRRYREEGLDGLEDRRSTPRRSPRRISEARERRIVALRRRRLTGWRIAERMRMPAATVYRVLRRAGLHRLSALEPKPPVRRFVRERAGELVHLDTKPLGRIQGVGHRMTGDRRDRSRGVGWEYAHVAIDDASRLAYVEILPDQRGETAVGFFERARRWFAKRRIAIERVMTDNGSCYVARRFRQALRRRGIRQIRTRPYRPQTNGKAERFIQTMLRGWAYARPYGTSNQRTRALPKWLRYYNEQRPHRGLAGLTPALQAQRTR